MKIPDWIQAYWQAVCGQDGEGMWKFLKEDACIRWHNTNEAFQREEFIQANCLYPGNWQGKVERCEALAEGMLTITRVCGEGCLFHVISIMQIQGEQIKSIDEYWSEDGEAPAWRKALHIATPIHSSHHQT